VSCPHNMRTNKKKMKPNWRINIISVIGWHPPRRVNILGITMLLFLILCGLCGITWGLFCGWYITYAVCCFFAWA
jgi:hypothetical protein